MLPVNLRSFRAKFQHHKKRMRSFLKRIDKNPPEFLDKTVKELAVSVWQEVDCLTCANCCKKMSPTFTKKDIKRIAQHQNMSPKEFSDKWLYHEKKDNDWMNRSQPCQFLEPTTNMCSIYEVRPDDCSGFPHFNKKKMADYVHVHHQNIEYCPATFKMVEKMMERFR